MTLHPHDPRLLTDQDVDYGAFRCCGDEDLVFLRCKHCGHVWVECYECSTWYVDLNDLSKTASSFLSSTDERLACPACRRRFVDFEYLDPAKVDHCLATEQQVVDAGHERFLAPHLRQERRRRAAARALEGLSIGDAFGEACFVHDVDRGTLPPLPWTWTDDTAMALSVFDELVAHDTIDPDRLARRFARRYAEDPTRGYGGTAHGILRAIGEGVAWQDAASRVFHGTGSMGNGAAMRVAPIGAYASDDLVRVVEMADASARPTHAHSDARAGAIAVAVATAHLFAGGEVDALFDVVLAHTPEGETRTGILRARSLLHLEDPRSAASILGSGHRLVSSDTVPFCLWSVAKGADDYASAIWRTVRGGGDRDTTCAIVGGIVAGCAEIPKSWREAREPLAT